MKGQAARQKLARGWQQYDNVVITLQPYTRTRSGAGGYTSVAGDPRPPQSWGVASSKADTQAPSGDGTVRDRVVTLIGPVGALVAVGDKFMLDGLPMEVNSVRTQPDGVYAEAVYDAG